MKWKCLNKKPWWMRSYDVDGDGPQVAVNFTVKWWAIPIIFVCKKAQWFSRQAGDFADSHNVVIGITK